MQERDESRVKVCSEKVLSLANKHSIITEVAFQITEIDSKVTPLKEELDTLDSHPDDLVTAAIWSVKEKYKWFKRQSTNFEV